ncbi:MAG: hypothetical protein CVV27_01670, partial [Candidatus Melainabacteria bacterium HGW-Melainabacteria-1]
DPLGNNDQGTEKTFIVMVNKLALTPSQLNSPSANVPYSQSIKALHGVGPYTWTVTPGVGSGLPPGITLGSSTSDTVTLSGTTNNTILSTTYRFTVTATDSLNRTAQQTYVFGCGDNILASYRAVQPVVTHVKLDAGPFQYSVSGDNAGSHTLTLQGSNFVSNSVVLIDKLVLATTFSSASQLTATVPAGIKPGKYNVVVISPNTDIGRIEGGLALAYEATGTASNGPAPVIQQMFGRNQPVHADTSDQELASQLLTNAGTASGAIVQKLTSFQPILIVGQNFTPQSRVYLSDVVLPSIFINETQVLTTIPVSQLFPDNPLQAPGFNMLQVVNANLEKSELEQGKVWIYVPFDEFPAEGPGRSYLGYVYPQRGPHDQDVTVYGRGCGFQRPHLFDIGPSKAVDRVVETSGIARLQLKAGRVFPDPLAYDMRVYRVDLGSPIDPNTAAGVYTALSSGVTATTCTPNIIAPDTPLGISVAGSGFIPGLKTDFIYQGRPDNNVFPALVTGVQTSLLALPVIPAGLPVGDYKLRFTLPASSLYPGGIDFTTPTNCLTISDAQVPPPTVTSISPATFGNGVIETAETLDCDVVDHSKMIEIHGTNFQPGASIFIGGMQVFSGTGCGNNRIVIGAENVIHMQPGTYPIYIQNPDGQIFPTFGNEAAAPQLTVTDTGGLPVNPPRINSLTPSYPDGQTYFHSLILSPFFGGLSFTVENIAPGATTQLVTAINDPIRPDDAFLTNLNVIGNTVTSTMPNLPGGSIATPRDYFLRIVNPDGQAVTFETPLKVVNAHPPEIETDPTKLASILNCKLPVCPPSGPVGVNTQIEVNGVDHANHTPLTTFGKHPTSSTVQLINDENNSVINLGEVFSTERRLQTTIPDTIPAGLYRIRIINPDGQTNDVTNGKYQTGVDENGQPTIQSNQVTFTVLPNSNGWNKSAKQTVGLNHGITPNTVLAGAHGRTGTASSLGRNGMMYIFGGADGRPCYNFATKTLLSYSNSSGWRQLASLPALGPNNNTPGIVRVSSSTAWKTGGAETEDRLFMFGGGTYVWPTSRIGIDLNNASVVEQALCNETPGVTPLNDLWMYNPNTNSWHDFANGGGGGDPLPQLVEAGMHYEPSDGKLYIFGGTFGETRADGTAVAGFPNPYIYKVDLNENTGTYTWSRIDFTPGPVVYSNPASPLMANLTRAPVRFKLVSDPDRSRFFLLGGFYMTAGATNTSITTDVWMYNVTGNTWTLVPHNGSPYKAREFFSASLDPAGNGRMFIYGGRDHNVPDNELPKNVNNDVRENLLSDAQELLIGSFSNFSSATPSLTWTSDNTMLGPGISRGHSSVWDGIRLLVFGGIDTDNLVRLQLLNAAAWPGTPDGSQPGPNPLHDPATGFWQYTPQ